MFALGKSLNNCEGISQLIPAHVCPALSPAYFDQAEAT